VDGVKTGHTIRARFVLVGSAHRGDARVISVVLGDPSEAARDTDTLSLLRYGLSLFRPRVVLRRSQVVARPRAKYRDDRVSLVPARPLTLVLRAGEQVTRRVRAPKELAGPMPAGRRVGSVTVLEHGRPARTVPLVTAAKVPGAGTLRKLTWTLGWPLTLVVLLGILGTIAVVARRLKEGRQATAR
jgi:D-alanyl-D-alanine carboxypeptidase (penicillin-binding protein 5/6)